METMAATGANNGARCPKRCTATNQERPAAKAVWATGTATLRQQLRRPVTCSARRDRLAEVIGMLLGRIGHRLGSGRVRRIFFRGPVETAIGAVASHQSEESQSRWGIRKNSELPRSPSPRRGDDHSHGPWSMDGWLELEWRHQPFAG